MSEPVSVQIAAVSEGFCPVCLSVLVPLVDFDIEHTMDWTPPPTGACLGCELVVGIGPDGVRKSTLHYLDEPVR